MFKIDIPEDNKTWNKKISKVKRKKKCFVKDDSKSNNHTVFTNYAEY